MSRGLNVSRATDVPAPRQIGASHAATPSTKSLRASSMFGLVVGESPTSGTFVAAKQAAARTASRLRSRLWSIPRSTSAVVLITGPSGSGKSLTLSRLARLLPPRSITWASSAGRRRAGSVVDQFDLPLDQTLRLLSLAGLADARLYAASAATLSEGELARLSIALAMARAARLRPLCERRTTDADADLLDDEGTDLDDDDASDLSILVNPNLPAPPTIFLDELGSGLDSDTARSLAHTLRRWADQAAPVRVIAATCRDDLTDALAPDLLVHQPLGKRSSIHVRSKPTSPAVPPTRRLCDVSVPPVVRITPPPTTDPILIRPGTRADYTALARFHYRAGPPATFAKILIAIPTSQTPITPHRQHPLAVLVISLPTLNAPWRAAAWPDLAPTGDKRADAAHLNTQLRTISRIIVDPRHRGQGIATRLLRAYLADPLTPRTEALAAMASACPLFTAAGMHEISCPPTRRDQRLFAALAAHSLHPHDLADSARLRALAANPPPSLARALCTWADAARATRPLLKSRRPLPKLLRAAAMSLASRGRVFVSDDRFIALDTQTDANTQAEAA